MGAGQSCFRVSESDHGRSKNDKSSSSDMANDSTYQDQQANVKSHGVQVPRQEHVILKDNLGKDLVVVQEEHSQKGHSQKGLEGGEEKDKSRPARIEAHPEGLDSVPPEDASALGLPYQYKQLGPPLPGCEEERQKTVSMLTNIYDAPSDSEIDNILKLVANIFQAPNVLVALFDDHRIFIRHAQGAFQRGDFPWRHSFCAWTMASKQHHTMVIPDATKDARFCENQFVVSEPQGVKFYVGSPLVASNGHRLGTLCFADFKPRQFNASQCAILNNLSELVTRELEKDIALQLKIKESETLQRAYNQLLRAVDCYDSCILFVDMSKPDWPLLHANATWTKVSGTRREEVIGMPLRDYFEMADGGPIDWKTMTGPISANGEVKLKNVQLKSAPGKALSLHFRPATIEGLDNKGMSIGVPSYVEMQTNSLPGFYFVLVKERIEDSAGSNVCRSSFLTKQENVLDGLQLGPLLGFGSFGRVYYGMWYGSEVAVKVMENESVRQKTEMGIALEALIGKDLMHPNMVRTLRYAVINPNKKLEDELEYGSGQVHNLSDSWVTGESPMIDMTELDVVEEKEDAGETWLLMEFCDRGSLQDAVDRGWLACNGEMNYLAVTTTALEIASAMQYLHAVGILHGDLSAFNVMLTSSGSEMGMGNRGFIAKVADFGMSRQIQITSRIKTQTYGTVTHMPPELVEGGELGRETDVYSFGVLLWEMCTGSRPWAGLSHGQVIRTVAILRRQLQWPPSVPEVLAELGKACLNYSPESRPSFQEVCKTLSNFQEKLLASSLE